MRKNIRATYTILVLCLLAYPAFAIEYRADFLEQGNPGGWTESLKTFEDAWSMAPSETVDVDVWICSVPDSNNEQDKLITSGLWIDFDPAAVNIVSVETYDGEKGPAGPWDPGLSVIVTDGGESGTCQIVCGNLACVNPDDNGDVIIAKVKFRYEAENQTATISIRTVPNFDTVVGCEEGTVYDLNIEPITITIAQGTGTSTTTAHSSTTTGPGTTSTTSLSTTTTNQSSTTTTTASNRWQTVYTKMWAADADKKLALLRTFRDVLTVQSELGRNYISGLYQYSQEIATLLIGNPLLCLETEKVIDSLLPNIKSFLQTKKINLTRAQRKSIESVLNHWEANAGTELKALIKNVHDDLQGGKISLL